MSEIIFDNLQFPINNLNINRVPNFVVRWDVMSRDIDGITRSDKWHPNDPNTDFFQVTFSTYNTKPLVEKILDCFSNSSCVPIQTPRVSFKHAIIQNATIDNDNIQVSLIAKSPTTNMFHNDNEHVIKIKPILEANYRYTQPSFVQLYQFGNYLMISTYPYKVNTYIHHGTTYLSSDYWLMFKCPVSSKPMTIKYDVGNLTRYCYTYLPPLFTDLVLFQHQKNQVAYAFGVHQTCEFPVYLKITDLETNETWYNPSNTGNLELAYGQYQFTPIAVIPDKNTKYIEGNSVYLDMDPNQKIIEFLSPTFLPLSKTLNLRVYEEVVLYFKGWRSFVVKDVPTDIEIQFDYSGLFECQVFSLKRNMNVTSFQVTVYDDNIDKPSKYFKSVNVYFHDIPIAGRPVFASIDGPVTNITFDDSEVRVTKLSDVLYKILFSSEGIKTMKLELQDGYEIVKHIVVSPGFKKIIQSDQNGNCKCITKDYWAIIHTPSHLALVRPNSVYTWTEYSFGHVPINVVLIQGGRTSSLQYRCNIYNKEVFDIVLYGRTLQLLCPPNTEVEHVSWYINNLFIGAGNTLQIFQMIPEGHFEVKAVIRSNLGKVVITRSFDIPEYGVNQIQLGCQPISPPRSKYLNATNHMVTIVNDGPEVTYEYLDTSLNIRMTKYYYLNRSTYISSIDDLIW